MSFRELLLVIACTVALLATAGGFAYGMMAAAAHDNAQYQRQAAARTEHQAHVARCLRETDDYSSRGMHHCDLVASGLVAQ